MTDEAKAGGAAFPRTGPIRGEAD